MSFKDKAEELIKKAEARSERIDGKIEENLGKYSDDSREIEKGQEQQEQAEAKRHAAKDIENKANK
jgi:uncharacterized protein YjbJ (UPF0337 family)